jgi:putative glutamine transport system substrate-binding protein
MNSIRACIIAAAIGLTGSASAQDAATPEPYIAKIRQRGVLNVGVKPDIPGAGYQNPLTGKFEGFTVDLGSNLAERIFRRPGNVNFKPTLPVTRITMLQQGLIDCDIETLFITHERWQQIDFSEPYWAAPSRIFINKNNDDVRGLKDLEGKRIAATKGSLAERQFRDPNSGYPKAELIMFDSIAQSIEAIRVGRVDAAVFDEVFGLAAMKATPDFKFVGEPVRFDYYGIGIAKGHPEFVQFLNAWLRDIKATGQWAEMYGRNLPGTVPAPPMPPFDQAFYK